MSSWHPRIQSTLCRGSTGKEEGVDVVQTPGRVDEDRADNCRRNDIQVYDG